MKARQQYAPPAQERQIQLRELEARRLRAVSPSKVTQPSAQPPPPPPPPPSRSLAAKKSSASQNHDRQKKRHGEQRQDEEEEVEKRRYNDGDQFTDNIDELEARLEKALMAIRMIKEKPDSASRPDSAPAAAAAVVAKPNNKRPTKLILGEVKTISSSLCVCGVMCEAMMLTPPTIRTYSG